MKTQLPNTWAGNLAARLREKDVQFSAFMAIKNGELRADTFENSEVLNTDPRSNATLVAGSALSAVLFALHELPEFEGNDGLAALHSLVAALATLDNGGSPDLLMPRQDAGGKRRHLGRDYVEDHALLCVELLVALDKRSRTSARKVVAKAFSKHGHKGRKKVSGVLQGLSQKSIFEWKVRFNELPQKSPRRTWLTSSVQKYTNMPEWPPTESELLVEIERIANHPLLKTKI
ncbi:MAG: hypothetical protein ABIQ32_04370 [Sphingomicrobium sp.]